MLQPVIWWVAKVILVQLQSPWEARRYLNEFDRIFGLAMARPGQQLSSTLVTVSVSTTHEDWESIV